MTSNKTPKSIFYWTSHKEWFRINPETDEYEINDIAPEEVKESFEQWKRQRENEELTGE